MFYREVLIFKFVNEIFMCDYFNESYCIMFLNGIVCLLKVCKLNFGNIFLLCVLVIFV